MTPGIGDPIRIGLVGLGVISRFYLAALESNPAVQLVAVCDRDSRRLGPHRGRRVHTGHREMLAAGGLDAVIVTTPNDSHAAVAFDALEAGLAVCVEKPLALRLPDGEELHRRAQAAGRVLMTAFHRRYNAAVRAALADQPRLTGITVRYLERIEDHAGDDAWYLDPARCGGGCVADNGPNAFDLVRLCAGDGELKLLDARLSGGVPGGDRHATVELLARPPGAPPVPARVELDWAYPGECKELVLTLADGSCRTVDMLAGHAGFKASLWHEYEGVVADFAARVHGSPEPDEGGIAALRLVDACYRDGLTAVGTR